MRCVNATRFVSKERTPSFDREEALPIEGVGQRSILLRHKGAGRDRCRRVGEGREHTVKELLGQSSVENRINLWQPPCNVVALRQTKGGVALASKGLQSGEEIVKMITQSSK